MLGCQTLDVERLIITFAKIIYSVRGDSVLHLGYFHIFSAPVDNNNLVEKIQIRLRIYWRNSLGRRAGELKQPWQGLRNAKNVCQSYHLISHGFPFLLSRSGALQCGGKSQSQSSWKY